MARPGAENAPRPQRIEHEQIATMDPRPVREVADQIPYKYISGIQENPNVKDCCKDPDNLTYQTFKTDPTLEQPNMAELKCTVCGCRHRRQAVATGKM